MKSLKVLVLGLTLIASASVYAQNGFEAEIYGPEAEQLSAQLKALMKVHPSSASVLVDNLKCTHLVETQIGNDGPEASEEGLEVYECSGKIGRFTYRMEDSAAAEQLFDLLEELKVKHSATQPRARGSRSAKRIECRTFEGEVQVSDPESGKEVLPKYEGCFITL